MIHFIARHTPRSLAHALLMTALLLAPTAYALPIVEHLDLQVGGERFLKVPPSPRVRVEPEGLITFDGKTLYHVLARRGVTMTASVRDVMLYANNYIYDIIKTADCQVFL